MPVANHRGLAIELCNEKRLFSPLAGRLVPKRSVCATIGFIDLFRLAYSYGQILR